MPFDESAKDYTEVLPRLLLHFYRLVHRVLSVTQNVHETLMQDSFRVTLIPFDATRKVAIAMEEGGLLQNAPKHVEVVRVDLLPFSKLPNLRQSRDVIELWRVTLLLDQSVAVSSTVAIEDVLYGTADVRLQLIVQDVEEERMVRRDDGLDRPLRISVKLY